MHKSILRLAGLALAAGLLLAGCGGGGVLSGGVNRPAVESTERQFTGPAEGDTIAVFNTSKGEIRAVLYPDAAPMAVENFEGLARQGYYNGNIFHRVVADFVIQTGDATQSGTGGASIWNNNAYPNELSDKLHHYSGAVALARAADGSVGNLSQFYIVQTPEDSVDKTAAEEMVASGVRQEVADSYQSAGGAPYLDGQDTVFGQVYSGMDVVDAIAQVECDESGRPLEPVTLNSVTITTYGALQTQATSSPSGSTPSA